MSKQKVILNDVKMISIAQRKKYIFAFFNENGTPQYRSAGEINKVPASATGVVFLKQLQSEHTYNGYDKITTTPYKTLSKRIGENQWEVDLDLLVEEFI